MVAGGGASPRKRRSAKFLLSAVLTQRLLRPCGGGRRSRRCELWGKRQNVEGMRRRMRPKSLVVFDLTSLTTTIIPVCGM